MRRGYGVSVLGDTQNPSGARAEHRVPPDSGWRRGAAEAHYHLSTSGLVKNNMFLLRTELSLSACGAAQCSPHWEQEMREPERVHAVLVRCCRLNTWGGSSSWRCWDISPSAIRWTPASSFPANSPDSLSSHWFCSLQVYLLHPGTLLPVFDLLGLLSPAFFLSPFCVKGMSCRQEPGINAAATDQSTDVMVSMAWLVKQEAVSGNYCLACLSNSNLLWMRSWTWCIYIYI